MVCTKEKGPEGRIYKGYLAETKCAELDFIELHQLLLFLKNLNDYGYLSIPYAIDVHQEIL